MQFRKDINGLRALAVIAVVLFHFNETWMPGGFAGVDVFFVISGFLMTGIIFNALTQNNFGVMDFYRARAKRIIPALAAVCMVLLVFGFFILTPEEYSDLGKHIASSMSFVSNIIYWQESGYFDVASQEKWLLHTWSLSVEWQFYILLPLLLVNLWKYLSVNRIKIIILLLTISSFVYSVVATMNWPDAAYYWLPTRAWEMLLGGVAYLYPLPIKNHHRKVLHWLGLTLILASYVLVSKDNQWPGYLAFIPVAGAFLIIQAQHSNSMMTGNIVAQKIGKWSYSIYLWHWPVVAAIYHYSLSGLFIYLGLALSVGLGFLSYRYIESTSCLQQISLRSKRIKIKPIYLVIVICLLSAIVFKEQPSKFLHPLPESVKQSIRLGTYECFNKNYQHKFDQPFCQKGDGQKKIFIAGDSHSKSLLPVMDDITEELKMDIAYAGYNGCAPLLGIYPQRTDQDEKNCHALNNKVFDHVKDNNFDYIFIVSRWTYYTAGDYVGGRMQRITTDKNHEVDLAGSIQAFELSVKNTFEQYANLGTKVIVMLQVPMQESKPGKIYYRAVSHGKVDENRLAQKSVSRAQHKQFQKETNDIITRAAREFTNITILDPTNTFCNQENCRVGNSSSSFYFDDDHLSVAGSFELRNLLKDSILSLN